VYDEGMFEQVSALKETIKALDLPASGDALVAGFEALDLLTAQLLKTVGEIDASDGWRAEGATSATAWLRHRTRQSRRDASRCARAARRLRDLPVTAAAYREGALSGGQVQAIMANLNDETAPLFAEAEDEMVPLLVPLSVPDVATAMQTWAQCAKDSLQDDEPDLSEPPPRTLFLSQTLNGRGELSAGLDPEALQLTEIALRIAESPDVEGEPPRSPAQRRADAFVDIMRFFLDHQTAQPGGRHRHHMNVIIRYEDLVEGKSGEFADGTRVDGATIQRLACDAGYHRVVTQGRSSILDYGVSRRNIPVNLFNALVVRDRGCRFPGCDRPPNWCEAHHIDHWENHGPTKIDNLVLACSRHHHLLHMPGWHIRLRPDATVEVTTPAGQNLVDRPPGHTADLFVDVA
jgi:5-methylcytosine-specific restriction protein A